MAKFEVRSDVRKGLQSVFKDPIIPAKFVYSKDIAGILKDITVDGLADAIDSLQIVQHAQLEKLTIGCDRTECLNTLKNLQYLKQLQPHQFEVLRNFFIEELQINSFLDNTTRLPYIVMVSLSTMDESKFCITIVTSSGKPPILSLDEINSFPETLPNLRSIKIDGVSITKSTSVEVFHRPNKISHVDIHIGGDIEENLGLLSFVLNAYQENLVSLKISGDENARKVEKREKLYQYQFKLQRLKIVEISHYDISISRFAKALYISQCRPTHVGLEVQKQPEKMFFYLNQIGASSLQSLSLSMSTLPPISELQIYKNLNFLSFTLHSNNEQLDLQYFQPVLEDLSSFSIGYGKDNPNKLSFNLQPSDIFFDLKQLTFSNVKLKGEELYNCQNHFLNATNIALINCQIGESENATLTLEKLELETLTLENCRQPAGDINIIRITILDDETTFEAKFDSRECIYSETQRMEEAVKELANNQFVCNINRNKNTETSRELAIILKKVESVKLDKDGTNTLRFLPATSGLQDEDFIPLDDDNDEKNSIFSNDTTDGDDMNDDESTADSNIDKVAKERKSFVVENDSGNVVEKDIGIGDNDVESENGNAFEDDNAFEESDQETDENNAHIKNGAKDETEVKDEDRNAVKNDNELEKTLKVVKKKMEKEEAKDLDYEFTEDEGIVESDFSEDEVDYTIGVRRSIRVVEQNAISRNLRRKRKRINYNQDETNADGFLAKVKNYRAVIRITY